MKLLNGLKFADMIQVGAHHLSENSKYVDALNVFPVPDGDTGTNMNLSMTSGAKETAAHASEHIGSTAAALSKGLLMGARGNSGVILSQLFRGFSKAIEARAELDAKRFADALKYGVDTAYKAVMKPVEGTILTVAREAAQAGVQAAERTEDLPAVMKAIVEEARASLERTPDLLPVLKEVGVVDSGGQGLVFVYEGFLASLSGEELPAQREAGSMDDLLSEEHHQNVHSFMNTEDIEFGFCTEFLVRFERGKKAFHEQAFRRDLSKFGDSLLVIADDEIAKVHVHSETPGDVLSYGQQYGELVTAKIENMRIQHTNLIADEPARAAEPETHEYAVLSIAMGAGVAALMKSIGASVVIEGGQTMNPSTEDIVNAIRSVGAKRVLILPNNKNIVMAAEQAAELAGIEAAVVKTKTIPQGLAALLAFSPDQSVESNRSAMQKASEQVKSGQVTYAVRDTSIDGIAIRKDDYMAISEGRIIGAKAALLEAASMLADAMLDGDSEIMTILYGEGVEESEAQAFADKLAGAYPDVEFEVRAGAQPLYPYIFSVE